MVEAPVMLRGLFGVWFDPKKNLLACENISIPFFGLLLNKVNLLPLG
jgi:hypothetical protein